MSRRNNLNIAYTELNLYGPIEVEFGVSNIEIVPSGQDQQGSGHHHIIIDAELPDMNLPIPADKNYVHFGDGSSKTTLNLEPGEHTLQLLLGDYLHIPHEPPIMSEKITVFVDYEILMKINQTPIGISGHLFLLVSDLFSSKSHSQQIQLFSLT